MSYGHVGGLDLPVSNSPVEIFARFQINSHLEQKATKGQTGDPFFVSFVAFCSIIYLVVAAPRWGPSVASVVHESLRLQ